MNRIFFVALLLSLVGCASPHELATCKGPLVALNTTHWQPTQEDMVKFDKMCPAKEGQ